MEFILAFDRDWLDKLIDSHNIVTVISRYVPLTKKGNNYWARCPFHHEKDPSFAVNEDRQFYHCFGCGESGNVIKFVQKIENIDFIEAVKRLADEVKLELPSYKFDDKTKELKQKRDLILKLNRAAALFYYQKLRSPEGKPALEYLHKRGLDDQTIKRFGLGYSPDYYQLVKHLISQGYTPDDLIMAGLCARNESGQVYDVFGGRVIIPIINNFNEVIAFGGRSLQATDYAKYRNTTATLVFDKSKTIYAINELKKAKQNEPIKYIILCEGYMDVIALQAAGFNTAVASMGTSLTKDQAKTLRRYAPLVYICYDGDAAGQKATLRGLDILEENGLEVKVVVLPEGLDPDDVIKKEGAQAFREKYLNNALPLLRYKLEALKKDYDLTTQDGRSKYAIAACNLASVQKDYVTIEAALKIIQSITGFTFESLKAQISMNIEGVRPALVEEKKDNLHTKAIKYLLWAIINKKDYARYDLPFERLPMDDLHRRILNYALSGKDIKKIFLDFDESEHKEIGEILEYAQNDSADPEIQKKYYEGFYAQAKKEILEREREELSRRFDAEQDPARKKELMLQIAKLMEEINSLKKEYIV
ncbi:MAG TPA: DNA primase [Clostridia bacterium]